MVKAILFDIGGTLVLTEEALINAIVESLRINKLPIPSKEEIIKHFGSQDLLRKVISQDTPDFENTFKKFYEVYKDVFPEKFLKEFKEIEGVNKVLNYLRKDGYKLGIVTGFRKREASMILDLFKWKKLFDVIITSDDCDEQRPSPKPIFTALKKIAISNKEAIYVGDTAKDIQSGKAAGVITIAVLSGAQPKEMLEKEKPDFIIESINELVDVTNQIK